MSEQDKLEAKRKIIEEAMLIRNRGILIGEFCDINDLHRIPKYLKKLKDSVSEIESLLEDDQKPSDDPSQIKNTRKKIRVITTMLGNGKVYVDDKLKWLVNFEVESVPYWNWSATDIKTKQKYSSPNNEIGRPMKDTIEHLSKFMDEYENGECVWLANTDENPVRKAQQFKVIDWFRISGRGDVATIDMENTNVKVGEWVILDDVGYFIRGIERGGGSKVLGILVKGSRKEYNKVPMETPDPEPLKKTED